MSVDIDLYEFKETLKDFDYEKDDFIKFEHEKGVAILEVGKTNKEIDKRLKELGYRKGCWW